MDSRAKNSSSFTADISYDTLELKKVIGSGSSGVVWSTEWNNQTVAVKTVNKKVVINTARLAKQYAYYLECSKHLHEVLDSLMQRRHRNVVTHYGYGSHASTPSLTHFFYVSEWMQSGDLYHYIHKNSPPAVRVKLGMAHGVARGLAYMHRRNILHADIKSENILLDDDLQTKITDFDRSRFAENTKLYAGTHRWMAPEIVFKESYNSQSSDVYSLGTVWWEIFAWDRPLKQFEHLDNRDVHDDFLEAVANEKHDPIPSNCPTGIAAYITFSWMNNPADRPTAEEMRQTAKYELKHYATEKELHTQLETTIARKLQRPAT